jgi:hypothetical protein
MPTPSAIYRAACCAAIAQHNRALAQVISSELNTEALACARQEVKDAYISASIAALAAYTKARQPG